MPSIGLSVMIVGITTKTTKNIDGKSHLEFCVKENLGEREPREFWVDVVHDPNLRYLSNKTNSINQNMRSTTAVLVGLINYEPPAEDDQITQEENLPGKHVLKLDDISLTSTPNNVNNSQSAINVPWLQGNGSSNTNHGRSNRSLRGATSRSKRGRTTLAQMSSTTSHLSEVLDFPAGMNTTDTTTTNTNPNTGLNMQFDDDTADQEYDDALVPKKTTRETRSGTRGGKSRGGKRKSTIGDEQDQD
jgi:hypothetical protein